MTTESTSWRIPECLDHVRQKYGVNSAVDYEKSVQSFVRKSLVFSYHTSQYSRILKTAKDDIRGKESGCDGHELFLIIAMGSLQEVFPKTLELELEANAIAAAQAAHSLFDIFAHVALASFGLLAKWDPNKRNPISFKSSIAHVLPYSAKLADWMTAIQLDHRFRYLNAFVNTTKHRCLVDGKLTAQFSPERRGGLRFIAFAYQSPGKNVALESFSTKWCEDFFQQTVELMQEVGKAATIIDSEILSP